jgi:hypothetical protein
MVDSDIRTRDNIKSRDFMFHSPQEVHLFFALGSGLLALSRSSEIYSVIVNYNTNSCQALSFPPPSIGREMLMAAAENAPQTSCGTWPISYLDSVLCGSMEGAKNGRYRRNRHLSVRRRTLSRFCMTHWRRFHSSAIFERQIYASALKPLRARLSAAPPLRT